MNFTASFDTHSLSEIANFVSFPVYLAQETQDALSQGGDLLVADAVANTWSSFKNPTGQLASSIGKVLVSPYELQIGASVPWAHRREFSFKGPDSLGRLFPNDPAAFYFTNALQADQQAVLALVEAGAMKAYQRIGTG